MAQNDTSRSVYKPFYKKSLWLGVDVLPKNNHRFFNLLSEYGMSRHWRVYLHTGYNGNDRFINRNNFRYWNESYYVKVGMRYVQYLEDFENNKTDISLMDINCVSLGFNLLYYNFHETGNYDVHDNYYGQLYALPYNIRFEGFGSEIPVQVWRELPQISENLTLRAQVSIGLIYTPDFAKKTQSNETSRNKYRVSSTGVLPIQKSLQVNTNFSLGLYYRFGL